MKTRFDSVLSAAISTATVGIALLSTAQEAPERPRQPAPPEVRRDEATGRRPGSFPENLLNEDQRQQLREFMEDHRERMRELDEKVAQARRELDEAMYSEQLDEKLVRDKASALAGLESERVLIRAKAFAKIRPSLTPEQRERMKERRDSFGPARGPRSNQSPTEPWMRRPEGRPDQPDRPRAEARLRDSDRFPERVRPQPPRPPGPQGSFNEPGQERFERRAPPPFRDGPPRDQFPRPQRPEWNRGQPDRHPGGPPPRFEPPRLRFPPRPEPPFPPDRDQDHRDERESRPPQSGAEPR